MHHRIEYHHKTGARVLSLLLCILFLFSVDPAVSGAFVVPVQAVSVGVAAAATRGVSGLQTLASDLSVRFGGMFSGFSAWLLSLTPDADPDADPDTDPEPETDPHDLAEVFWNCAPDDVIDTDTNTVILKGGDDANDGATAATPVLTWEKAVSLAAPGGKIWVMTQETVSGEAGAFILRSGNVEGLPTVLDYYAGNTSLFHVTDSVGLYLSDLDAQDDNLDPATYRRLALLDQGALRIGENAVLKGNIQIEQFMIDLQSEVFVDAEAVADFASNVQLEFRFGIDPATYLTLDRDLNVVDLVEFPADVDASAFLPNITLHPSLQDESAMSYIWKTRTKLGYPNIIQAYLAEPYDGAVYISGFGDDLNDGMYPDTPVYSYARAIAILTGTAADSAAINQWRQEHGGYQVNEGVIRIVGAPVHVGDQNEAYHAETWTMPVSTYWYDENDNTVSPSWVERYKNYTGTLVEACDACVFTLRDITIKGNYANVPNAVGSILHVSQLSDVTIGTGALLTENHAESGGGITLSGAGATVLVNGGSITDCRASTADGLDGKGGGVYVDAGDFELRAGEISSNYAYHGGGVYETAKMVAEEPGDITIAGNVKLLGGSVTANSATEGGGVFTTRSFVLLPASATSADIAQAVTDYGTGNICCINVTGNTAGQYGGGWFAEDCTFVMDGGEISGNAVNLNMLTYAGGGGIALRRSFFLMKEGAEVSGNTVIAQTLKGPATMLGGGVYCASIPEAVLDAATGEVLKYPIEIRQGAEIFDNTLENTLDYTCSLSGGGIHIGGAAGGGLQQNKLCLVNGEICGNVIRTRNYGSMYGGGLSVNNAPVVLAKFSAVERNTVTGWGTAGGVGVSIVNAALYLTGGLIRYNVRAAGSFNSSYTYATRGGGLYIDGGAFYMNAGAVMSNSLGYAGGSNHLGGGIFLNNTIAALDTDSPFVSPYDSNPSSVLISQNTGFSHGGGIYLNGAGAGLVTRLLDGSDPDLTDVIIEANTVTGNGGGLYAADNATVVLRSVTLRYNQAGVGGGAAYIIKSSGLLMNDVTVQENTAPVMGGVGVAGTATTNILNSTFTGNEATSGNGGGLFFTSADFSGATSTRNVVLNVTDCVFEDNTAANYGGAIVLAGTPYSGYTYVVTLQGCTIGGEGHGNGCTAADASGGQLGCGGGIYNVGAALTVNTCVVTYNSAYKGGGIYNCSGTLTVSAGTAVRRNQAFYGGGIYTETGEVRLLSGDLTQNAVLQLSGGVAGGQVLPLLCEGTSVYSRQAFVYLDLKNVAVSEFYFYTRAYCLRLLYADSEIEDEVHIALNVSEGANRYVAGDHVVEPATDGTLTSVVNFENNFTLVREAADAYDLVAVSPNLVLAPRSVYIDGVNGDDSNSGSKPTDAVKTFAVARQKLVALLNANPTANKMIYIVNTVTVSDTQVWSFDGYTMPAVDGEGVPTGEMIAVYGVTMQAYIADNTLSVGGKALVLVDGGELTFEGITLDGNRSAFASTCANFGFYVNHNGALTLTGLATVQNHRSGICAVGDGNDETDRPAVTLNGATIKNCDYNNNGSYASGSDPYREMCSAGVTVRYGTLNVDEAEISGNIGYKYGGGLYLRNAAAELDTLYLRSCRVVQGLPQGEYYTNEDRYYNTSGSGGGLYAYDSNVTMRNSEVSGCGKSGQNYGGGAGVSVTRGSFSAIDCLFTNNGYNTAYSGALFFAGAVVGYLDRCTFTKNNAYYGAALQLEPEYSVGTAPVVTANGCTFGGPDAADKNASSQGGGAIFSHGKSGCQPVLRLGSSAGYDENETPVETVDTLIQNNYGGQNHGAVYLSYTQFYAAGVTFADNMIVNGTSTIGTYGHGASQAFYSGGAAVYSYGGRAEYNGCTVTNNSVARVSGQNQPFLGAIAAQGGCVFSFTGGTVSANTITGYQQDSTSQYYGGGMSVLGGSATVKNTAFTENTITIPYSATDNSAIYQNQYALGGALFLSNTTAAVESCTFTGNRVQSTDVRPKYMTRGSAVYATGSDVSFRDIVTADGEATVGGASLYLNSSTRIRFAGNMEISDGNIALAGNDTPISLAAPLTGTGTLTLWYDDQFLGKHIVCGYSSEEADYHNVSDEAGALNAWAYLAAGASPRFVAAEDVDSILSLGHLSLVSGQPYAGYEHDIVVKNLSDVYLDGQNGVDPVYNADGDLISFGIDDGGVTHDGRSPAAAFKTFAACKKLIYDNIPMYYPDLPPQEGAYIAPNIIVCGRVDITGAEDWTLPAFHTNYLIGSTVQPRVVRYMNNSKDAPDSTRYPGYLIEVQPGGELCLEDIIISGNCAANEYPRVCSSLLHVNGGGAVLGSGTRLTDNNAETGGGVRVDSGICEMTGNAVIDNCTVDVNYASSSYFGGSANGYGGGVYVRGGEFIMNGADCEIASCGWSYVMSYAQTCYGALVYVNGGIFRQRNGALRDAHAFAKGDYAYQCYTHGAVFAAGANYNEETGSGTLVEIGDRVIDNFLGSVGYGNRGWGYGWFYTYGSAIAATGGTVRLLGPLQMEYEGALQTVSPGAYIANNRLLDGVNYGYIYMNGANALLEMQGGEVIDAYTSSHSQVVHLTQGAQMHMTGGLIRAAYVSTGAVYLYYNNSLYSRFTMDGGEIYGTHYNGSSMVNVNYGCTFVMNGGSIHGAGDRGVYNSSGAVRMTGGEIYDFHGSGVESGGSFTMSGGEIHHTRIGVHCSGTCTMNGGEIDNCSVAGVNAFSGTCTINAADIHHNVMGVRAINGPYLNITSDNADIHNNQNGIRLVNCKSFDVTGGLIHDNVYSGPYYTTNDYGSPFGGGINIGRGTQSCYVRGAKIYNNSVTYTGSDSLRYSRGGGIYIEPGYGSISFTFTGCEIYNNTAYYGGGLYVYDDTSGNYTHKLSFNSLNVHDNTATSSGGGMGIESNTAGQHTMNVTAMACNIHDNSAGASGGGVFLAAGLRSASTTANPAQLVQNVNFTSTQINNNTAATNGGGVFIQRRVRNNVRIGVQFGTEGKDPMATSSVNGNTAGWGGGIETSTAISGSYPAYNVSDITVVLSDTSVSGNVASGGGGGIQANRSKFVLNNASVTKNETGGDGGGIRAGVSSDFMITQGYLDGNVAAGNGNGMWIGTSNVKLVNNYLQTGENDDFYLAYRSNPLLMYKSFTNAARVYKVYPSEEYVAGDIVVHPTGLSTDASPYLRNFISIRPGTVLERRYPDIILGRIIFLDGETGIDPVFNGDGSITYQTDDLGVLHDGTAPDKAFATFAASKRVLGSAPGSIYVSGPVEISQDETWSLGEQQYVRRYCGFTVSADTAYPPFKGDMFTVTNCTLTLENITIQGAFNAADDFAADGSVFVLSGGNLTVNEGTFILENRAVVNGAGVRIETGEMYMTGGEISGNTYVGSGKGGGVYQGDTLTLSGDTLKITDDIYLAAGDAETADRVITVPALNFAPADASTLYILVENPADGRDIVAYPAGSEPGDAQKLIYDVTHDPDVAGQYIVDNEPARRHILELRLPYQVYLDGVNGSDANDGKTPETSVKTVQRAYELIRDAHTLFGGEVSGGLIHVVDTVTVTAAMALSQTYVSGGVTVDAEGPVSFKRYAQPTAHASIEGFERPTNVNALFNVASGGSLTLSAGERSMAMGESFQLMRVQSDSHGAQFASPSLSNRFCGDLYFSASSGVITTVLHIYVEDYLYGVLPYEMGNSSHIEALKAQAVAARTYTMRAMNASASSLYDVVDTTGDQVYSGTPSGNANCVSAVDATKGIVAKNGSSLTATYYTASNGGQTESIKNAWGTNGYAYLGVKDDPYDLANPDSRKVSFSVSASGNQSNATLGRLLNQKAAVQFGTGAAVTAVTAEGVVTADGVWPCDAVVFCPGTAPDTGLRDTLAGVLPCVEVGNAHRLGRAIDAIEAGCRMGCQL